MNLLGLVKIVSGLVCGVIKLILIGWFDVIVGVVRLFVNVVVLSFLSIVWCEGLLRICVMWFFC